MEVVLSHRNLRAEEEAEVGQHTETESILKSTGKLTHSSAVLQAVSKRKRAILLTLKTLKM